MDKKTSVRINEATQKIFNAVYELEYCEALIAIRSASIMLGIELREAEAADE